MSRTVRHALAALVLCGASTIVSGQTPPAAPAKPAVQAFEHYERVRVALAADKLTDVAPHARALAAVVGPVGGAGSKKAADAIAAATTIDDARKHFGDLSTILVPVFQAEAIPGTTAYICEMKKKPWVQRGDKIENPYYGKSMLTCGSPLPARGK